MIHVIAVAFQKFGEMRVFVQSLINQTKNNWFLTIIHDGPDEEFNTIMEAFRKMAPERIEYLCTPDRFNDYGHSLRDMALKDIKGDYVLLTNADNYFIPKAVEFMTGVLEQSRPDVVMFDMVHSHNKPGGRPLPSYSYFETQYKRGSIDVSAAIVEASLAARAGFRDKTHDGDATYFEDVLKAKGQPGLSITKIRRVLFVHN